MKTSTFNRIFENARSVNNGEEWYILNSGTLIKVH